MGNCMLIVQSVSAAEMEVMLINVHVGGRLRKAKKAGVLWGLL